MKHKENRDVARTVVLGSLMAASSLLIGTTALSAQTGSTGSKSTGSMNSMRHDSSSAAVRMLAVVSRDEIDAGKLAVTKATRADVKAYAQKMIDEHTKALTQLGDSAKNGGWAMGDSAMGGNSGGMTGNARGSGSTGTTGSMGSTGTSGSMGTTGTAGSMGTTGTMGSATGTSGSGSAGSGAMGSTSTQGQSGNTSAMRNGDDAMKLHAANVAAMEQLKNASGATFDKMYVSTQIEGHTALLKALDKQSASTQQGVVADLKATVQTHLDMARKLETGSSGMKP